MVLFGTLLPALPAPTRLAKNMISYAAKLSSGARLWATQSARAHGGCHKTVVIVVLLRNMPAGAASDPANITLHDSALGGSNAWKTILELGTILA